MDRFQPGDQLHGRYMVQSSLGIGGMGTVYLAEDQRLTKKVAIKENISPGEESSQQFLLEARLLAALHHPNLPRVTDYFIEGPYQYLVMDYLPGSDLQILLEKEGRQNVESVLGWGKQIGEALSYMHSRRPPVFHRDIKPANIKIQPDGKAILVDFGIAKASEESQKTAAGAKGFTPGFAPPEQAGGGRTGPYSDQYALAATVYNMLTGVRPVDSVKRVLDGEEIIPARTLNPELPSHISSALSRAMSIQPDDRFVSVQDFLKALHDPHYAFKSNQGKNTRSHPVWFIPALALISFLVLAIISIAAIVFFKLIPVPVEKTITPSPEIAVKDESTPKQPTLTEFITMTAVKPGEITPSITPSPRMIAAGTWLAYTSDREDGTTRQIWLMKVGMDIEGKPVAVSNRQLTTGPGDKSYPAWSPDGQFVIYSAPSTGSSLANKLDIWRIPVEGGEPVDLSNRAGDDLFASWSSKESLITFTNYGREDGVKQIYIMESDGSDQQRISTIYDESQGIWSPDMQWLFYVIAANGNNYFYQRSSTTAYQTPQPYDVTQVFGRLGQVTDPAFSPDGSLLAYTRSKGRDQRIGVVDFSSRGASSTLITKTGKDYDPSWATDGKWIAFTSERDGHPQIYIMTSAGLVQTAVSLLTAHESNPAWQP